MSGMVGTNLPDTGDFSIGICNQKEMIESICKILWKYDPVGFSKSGICGPMEYDIEAKMILKYLNNEKTITIKGLAFKIAEILVEMFSTKANIYIPL
jgi:hypothetical protein